MNFKQRLKRYLIGMILGMALVAFFFKGRLSQLTSWLPGNRVRELLIESETRYTPEALCQLTCYQLDTADVSTMKATGDVVFKLSDTHSEPKHYVLDGNLHTRKVRMTFATADSVANLISVTLPETVVLCGCGD